MLPALLLPRLWSHQRHTSDAGVEARPGDEPRGADARRSRLNTAYAAAHRDRPLSPAEDTPNGWAGYDQRLGYLNRVRHKWLRVPATSRLSGLSLHQSVRTFGPTPRR